MKKVLWILLPLPLAIPTLAQEAPPASAAGLSASQPASWTITERGPHHRLWSRVSWATNHQGQVEAVTNSAYTELSTGLHFWDPATAQWAESQARFELTPQGYAVARRGQHQVILAPNINATNAVDLQMPDGQRLTSRPLGLAFHDTASGKNVLIAELKDCAGQWLSPNVVIYPSAFNGLQAALRYTYTKAGFEQDVILYENPGSPLDHGLPATSQLEIWTEFFEAPTPRLAPMATADAGVDEQVEFGAMALGQGQAYFLSLANHDEPSLPVRKSWQQIGERKFLVEAVDYAAAKPLLDRLVAVPQRQNSRLAQKVVTGREALLVQFTRPPVTQAKQLASIRPGRLSEQPGLVLDYTTLNSSQTNYVFKGDTTYYISGTVNLYNTTTLEGAAVIKFTNSTSAKISLSGPLLCQTEAYRPAVLTSKDDNTVGESITGSTGNPSNTNWGTYLYSSVSTPTNDLRHLRLSYAGTGLAFDGLTNGVWHCQFLKCNKGIDSYNQREVRLYNVLMTGSSNCIVNSTNIRGQHVTVDVCSNLVSATGASLALTNSLLTAVVSVGVASPTYDHVVTASSGSGIYQVVGAGSYYLSDSSTNRDTGTTNIGSTLANDLKSRTTYPPIELTNNFTTDTTLSAQAQRDTDTPDVGYHYDPLDYVVSGRTLTNATLTLTNGVALGTYGTSSSYGIYMRKGSSLVSEGLATSLNHIGRYNTVQEQTTTNWSASTVAHCVRVGSDTSPRPQGTFRFTAWSLLGGRGYHLYANSVDITTPFVFKDCQLGPGYVDVGQCSTVLTNCLLERVNASMEVEESGYSFYAYNNLFRFGSLDLGNYASGSCTYQFNDNLFDQTSISQSGTITHSNNAYVTGYGRLTPTNANDVVLTNAPIYQTSYLGRYYYPTNDGMLSLLIDAGSRRATNATLYHYTTTTNQVKEANSMVDIGFHYAAVDPSTGLPYDTDGDGIPDYLEDRNGNGTVDSGETDWQNASDLGLKVLITRPRKGAVVP